MNRLHKLKKVAVFCAILAICFGMLPNNSLADNSILGRSGEGVRPITDTEIKMVSQLVRVKAGKQESEVEIDYVFQNTGEKTEVLMGIPEGRLRVQGQSTLKGDVSLHNLTAYIDSQKVNVWKERGIFLNDAPHKQFDYPFWFTWSVKFERNEVKSIRNKYKVKNTINSSGEIELGYILRTGAHWKGSIGETKVIFELDQILPYQLEGVFPADYRFEGKNLVWYYKDFEPTENIRILASPQKDYFQGEMFLGQKGMEALERYEQLEQYELALGYLYALKDNGQIMDSEEAEEFFLIKKAAYQTELGIVDEAENTWSQLMAKDSKYSQIYYYLAKIYHEQNNERKLVEVYRKIKKLKINPQLLRWIETMLPKERVKENQPVINNIQIVRSKTNNDLLFKFSLGDADGNLHKMRVKLWYYENKQKKLLADYQPEFLQQLYEYESQTEIGQLPYYTVVYAQVSGEDSKGNSVDSGERSFLVQDIRTDWVSLPIGKINFNYIGLNSREINKAKVLFKQALKEIKQELNLEPKLVIHANVIGDRAQVIYSDNRYREDFFQATYSLKTKEPNRKLANETMLRILTQNMGSGWIKASPWLLDDLTQNIVFNKNKVKTAYLRDKGEERFRGFLLRVGETGDVDSALQGIYGMDLENLDEKWAVFKLIPWLTMTGIFLFMAVVLVLWRRRYLREQKQS